MSAKLLRRVRCTEFYFTNDVVSLFLFFSWAVSLPWLSDCTADGMMRSAVASEGRLSRIRPSFTPQTFSPQRWL